MPDSADSTPNVTWRDGSPLELLVRALCAPPSVDSSVLFTAASCGHPLVGWVMGSLIGSETPRPTKKMSSAGGWQFGWGGVGSGGGSRV